MADRPESRCVYGRGKAEPGGVLEDFKRDISSRRGNEKYAAQTHQRAARLLAGVVSLSGITPAGVNETTRALREGGKYGKASMAQHLRAAKAFTRWLIRNGRTREDALLAVRVSGTVARSERVHVRRALGLEEFERLVTHTAQAGARQGMSGTDRFEVYAKIEPTRSRAGVGGLAGGGADAAGG